MNWHERQGMCYVMGKRRYVPRSEYHKSMQRFWTDLGMVEPEQWRYCAAYEGVHQECVL